MLRVMEIKSNEHRLTQKEISRKLGFLMVLINDKETIIILIVHTTEKNILRKILK